MRSAAKIVLNISPPLYRNKEVGVRIYAKRINEGRVHILRLL